MYSYYRPQYRSSRRSAPVKQPQMATVLGAEVMWALAAYADRVNGGRYVKDTQRDDRGNVVFERNRDIIRTQSQLGLPDVTDEDFEVGRQARQWHRGRLIVKMLRNEPLREFEQSLSRALECEEFSNRDNAMEAAVVASQIRSYHAGQKYESMLSGVDNSPLAGVGSKVTVQAQVIRSVFSQNYNRFFITARTQCNRVVFFGFGAGFEPGQQIRIQGRVKAHRPDSTQLNYVKMI